MASRSGLLGRVMDGKVFKQVTGFSWKRIRTRESPSERLVSSETGEDVDKSGTEQTRPHTSPNAIPQSATIQSLAVEISKDNPSKLEYHSSTEPMDYHYNDGDRPKDPSEDGLHSPVDPKRDTTQENEEIRNTSTKPPLNSLFPEILPFTGHDGEPCSALALTKTMIWQWNTIFRCEAKILRYRGKLHDIDQNLLEVEEMIGDLSSQEKEAHDPSFDRERVLGHLSAARELERDLHLAGEMLEEKIHRAAEEMGMPQRQLFRDMKEVMEEDNLLDPEPDDSEAGSQIDGVDIEVQHEERRQESRTSSEVARYAAAAARDAAIDDVHKKERHLQDCRHKVDHWHDYYDSEYRAYCKCVDEGTMAPARTMFDNVLLQEEQEATQELIQAEHDFAEARKHAKDLGVHLHDTDLESGFPDYVDDGYRESLEAELVEHVDRDRISRWMDQEDDKTVHSAECDDWESKTVELCDSVSVVAEGKDRSRIDRWRSMCELMKADLPEIPEQSSSKSQ